LPPAAWKNRLPTLPRDACPVSIGPHRAPIRPHMTGHTVRTAAQQGWDKLSNGELLNAAEEGGFEVLLTTDKNMRYQQNLSGRKIAIVVLGKELWPLIEPHVEQVVVAVNASTPGSYTEVDTPVRVAVPAPANGIEDAFTVSRESTEKLHGR
jgi:hypothetical protein